MTEKDLKTTLAWVLESGIAKEPKEPIEVPHDGVIEHVAKCPECDKPVRPNRNWTVEGKMAYLPVSFCSRCGTPIDWTGVLSEDELGETDRISKKPKNVIIKHPGGIPTYYGDCPNCDQQSKSMIIDKYLAQRKLKYQIVSFCPRCGQALDWTGIISREELEELQ